MWSYSPVWSFIITMIHFNIRLRNGLLGILKICLDRAEIDHDYIFFIICFLPHSAFPFLSYTTISSGNRSPSRTRWSCFLILPRGRQRDRFNLLLLVCPWHDVSFAYHRYPFRQEPLSRWKFLDNPDRLGTFASISFIFHSTSSEFNCCHV